MASEMRSLSWSTEAIAGDSPEDSPEDNFEVLLQKVHTMLNVNQVKIICLASRALRIAYFKNMLDLPQSPPLLYMLLQRVGFPVERPLRLASNYFVIPQPSEAEILSIHRLYPDLDMLLTLANMVSLMSEDECIRFKGILSNEHLISSEVSKDLNAYDHLATLYSSNTLKAHDLRNVLRWLDQSHCSKYFKHITEYLQRHAAQRALRGLEEGYVSLNNIKMVVYGPPFVGKTAFKDLLLNNPRPLKHSSTPITARPIKAIERIAAGRKVWKEIREVDLLRMLSDAINHIVEDFDASLTEKFTSKFTSTDIFGANYHIMKNQEASCIKSVTPTTPTPQLPDECTDLSLDLSASLESSASLDLSVDLSIPTLSAKRIVTTPKPHRVAVDQISHKIIEQLSSMERNEESRKLHEATWIHLLDSGGQPQFTDLLRMFVRGNSLYIIVMKVTESLHDKPTFVYSIDGKPLNAPKEMTMTNLQIIESFVHSVAASTRDQLGAKSQPAFAIVATHCDQSRLKRFLGWDETVKEKNGELLSHLSEFLDLFVFYNRDSNELIFPVDNLCWLSREKISAEIRHRLLSSRSDISFSVKIPVRWYVFDLNMKEEASKETHGMISLQSCYTIGSKLGMDNSEVDQCLIYLDSMRLCIYYPNLLPHVVFTNPQFLVESLSNIVRVSFVDDLQQILPKGVSLSDDVVQSLKRDGIFDGSLLNSLGLKFFPNLFSESDLLSLLQNFRVISIIKAASDTPRYFIPILLPAERLTEEQKLIFRQKINPLLVTFNSNVALHVSQQMYLQGYLMYSLSLSLGRAFSQH